MQKNNLTGSIVLYKTPIKTAQKAISSILRSDLCSRLFLVDNSPDNCLQKLQKIDDRIVYRFNNENVGYGTAHNIAIRHSLNSNTKYHIAINPDIYFEYDTISNIYQYMEKHDNVGQVMPKVLNPNGEIQYLAKLLPGPWRLICRRFFNIVFFENRLNTEYELRFTGYNKIMNVPYLSGCFMFLRCSALKSVGLFDERFFMYPEDIDLTRRIHSKYETIYYPYVNIFHEHQKESFHSFRMTKIHVINMIKYYNKWGWFFDKQRSNINKKALIEIKEK